MYFGKCALTTNFQFDYTIISYFVIFSVSYVMYGRLHWIFHCIKYLYTHISNLLQQNNIIFRFSIQEKPFMLKWNCIDHYLSSSQLCVCCVHFINIYTERKFASLYNLETITEYLEQTRYQFLKWIALADANLCIIYDVLIIHLFVGVFFSVQVNCTTFFFVVVVVVNDRDYNSRLKKFLFLVPCRH